MLLPIDVEEQHDLATRVSACQQLRTLVRDRSGAIERYAYKLEHTVGYAYSRSSTGEVVIEIENYGGLVEVDPSWGRELHVSFGRFRLADHLELAPDQSIGRITWRGGRLVKDPVTETVVDLSKLAARFNGSQVPQQLEFDELKLTELLRNAFDQRKSDGRALLAALPDMGLSLPIPTTTFVVLRLDEPSPGWIPGANATLTTVLLPRLGDQDVEFRIVRARDGGAAAELTDGDLLQYVFGIDTSSALALTVGDAIDGLSRMLGYGRGEVRFHYSELAGP